MQKTVIVQYVSLSGWVLSLLAYMVPSVVLTVYILRAVYGDLYVALATAIVLPSLFGVFLELRDSTIGKGIWAVTSCSPSRILSHYFFWVVITSGYMGIPVFFFYWWTQ